MKNKLLAALFIGVFISGCTRETKVMKETYSDGSPKREIVYSAGLGGDRGEMIRETTWYPHKKLQMTGEYKNGKRDGKWIYYYENGNIWSEGYFRDGKGEGRRITHYENGKIFYDGYYARDKRVGIWKFYDEQGKFIKSIDYTKTK